jgi:acyl-ACP thioesterase
MEMVPCPGTGRAFRGSARAELGDVTPSGRVRLDALARWIQNVSYADLEDAGVADLALWVIRRMRISVRRFPRFGERLELHTFVSGLGLMWAERRTTIMPDHGGDGAVEAAALWVHLDRGSQRPTPLLMPELDAFARAAGGAACQRPA